MNDSDYKKQRSFVVVLQASSGTRFNLEDPILNCEMPTPFGLIKLLFKTKHINEGFSTLVPRELWVDARGQAPSLDAAIEVFGNTARSLASVIAVSANAPIDELDVVLGFENTPGCDEREFFQIIFPDEKGIPRQGRRVNAVATVALLEALDNHIARNSLLRAVGQYYLSLSHWRPGREILALAHLYMGIDALTKVALEQYCTAHNLTKNNLITLWNIKKEEIDSKVRLKILFDGDKECYQKAKQASDAFEHGYLTVDEIRHLASETRDKTASYLRSSIIRLSNMERSNSQILLKNPYDVPLESWPFTKRIRGHLISKTDSWSEEGQEYPFLRGTSTLKSFSRDEFGEYVIEVHEQLQASLGKEVRFRPASFEIWGPKKDLNV